MCEVLREVMLGVCERTAGVCDLIAGVAARDGAEDVVRPTTEGARAGACECERVCEIEGVAEREGEECAAALAEDKW